MGTSWPPRPQTPWRPARSRSVGETRQGIKVWEPDTFTGSLPRPAARAWCSASSACSAASAAGAALTWVYLPAMTGSARGDGWIRTGLPRRDLRRPRRATAVAAKAWAWRNSLVAHHSVARRQGIAALRNSTRPRSAGAAVVLSFASAQKGVRPRNRDAAISSARPARAAARGQAAGSGGCKPKPSKFLISPSSPVLDRARCVFTPNFPENGPVRESRRALTTGIRGSRAIGEHSPSVLFGKVGRNDLLNGRNRWRRARIGGVKNFEGLGVEPQSKRRIQDSS